MVRQRAHQRTAVTRIGRLAVGQTIFLPSAAVLHIWRKGMTTKHSNENALKAERTTNQFLCELCKQPTEKAVDCVEVN